MSTLSRSAAGIDAGAGSVIRFPVTGLSCAACAGRVETALGAVPGVRAASVNAATRVATVELGPGGTTRPLADAVARAGYGVAQGTARLELRGLHCASCVGRVEHALAAVPGVVSASVNLATSSATVATLGAVRSGDLTRAVAQAGYEAVAPREAGQPAAPPSDEATGLGRRAALAALLTLPLFVVEMGGHLVPGLHAAIARGLGHGTLAVAELVLATLVLAGPGRDFFRIGLRALARGAPDMNALVALGAGAAYLFSLAVTVAPRLLPSGGALYFEAACVIVTLVLTGRWLEARARGRASEAIRRLADLRPPIAHVLDGERVVDRPVEEVRVGDLLELRPGERVPLDGEVEAGGSYVDEAMITGEPAPVRKEPGATLTGGTVNGSGVLRLRVTTVGDDTVLARIVRMVGDAQGGKLPIQALVDKVTLWFVPAVIAAALLTFVGWLAFGPSLAHALVAAVAVVIVACPCAMGLATPTSIMVATGRGAQLGILFRRGEALQRLAGVTTVVFDKTGTLTLGRPTLTDVVPAPGFTREAVLAVVAALEAKSEHPLGRAVVEAAEGLALAPVADVAALPGRGLAGRVDGVPVLVGSARAMREAGLDPAPFAGEAERLAAAGRTPFYAAIDGRLAAILAVADPIKPSAAATVATLKARGLTVAMLTGDESGTARAVAREIGLDVAGAELLPEGKLEALRALRSTGARIAFVGDGINDTPALAQADIGVAIGTGTDIAMEAADVVLMSGDPAGVADAVALSRAAMANIRQNLFWAFAYNAALIPVAAGLLALVGGPQLSPALAAGAMALSSVFVLTNALRLRRFTPESRRGGAEAAMARTEATEAAA